MTAERVARSDRSTGTREAILSAAEELFAVPMDHARQAERLLQGAESCVFIPDAHKTMAVIQEQ